MQCRLVLDRSAQAMARLDQLHYERVLWSQGYQWVAGVDEAGRGPLAGPVVAAAVILPREWEGRTWPKALKGLNDSKQLTEAQREYYFGVLTGYPDLCHGVAFLEAEEVDRLNILQATHAAMNAALRQLMRPPEHVLVDGLAVRSLAYPQTALVKGDCLSFSIAAASVLAKVTRDRRMVEYDQMWPHYGFASHKGYATEEHLRALAEHGPCPIHRRSFSPLKPEQTEFW
jgi:ribonuclease HII